MSAACAIVQHLSRAWWWGPHAMIDTQFLLIRAVKRRYLRLIREDRHSDRWKLRADIALGGDVYFQSSLVQSNPW